MQATDFPDPDAAEFAGVRADLARLCALHKADLGMAGARDDLIIGNVNNIAAALVYAHNDKEEQQRCEAIDPHRPV